MSSTAVPTVPAPIASTGFAEASENVLAYLRAHHPMTVWTVTRVEDGQQRHLHLGPNDYGLVTGSSVPWEDSYCVHMVSGEAPRVSPDTQLVPAYRQAAVNDALQINAYAGVPIQEPDGSLFGVLCGLDRARRSDLAAVEPLLDLLRGLLSSVLAGERALEQASLVTTHALVDAETDAMTGLLNRRGWDRAVAEAQQRLQRLGDPSVLVVADLDGLKTINDRDGHSAGDRYLTAAATGLRGAVRPADVVARLGGDEFGILLVGLSATLARTKVAELDRVMGRVGVEASFGWSAVSVGGDFGTALALADAAMYTSKRRRRDEAAVAP